ncbi:MAG: HD domain-containing protein [Bacteroidota bacterium]|nr:MAG: HD domain-containing protein [Bacteroidota bacterium]
MNSIALITKAYEFAAEKHCLQRRKGAKDVPYINHPIEVANLLSHTSNTLNQTLIIAAILHDVLEDTNTSAAEIEQLFGSDVLSVVLEVTDNMRLSKLERRAAQISKASTISDLAKQIKIADKTCNILDILTTRLAWTRSMKIEYIVWAMEVVKGCRGVNPQLEAEFDKACQMARNVLGNY